MHSSRLSWYAAAGLFVAIAVAVRPARPADIEEGYEGPQVSWRIAESDCNHRVVDHGRGSVPPHRGSACERIAIEAGGGTILRLASPIGPAAAIDELSASVWVRSSRGDVRVAVRVVLPRAKNVKTGRAIELLVPGGRSRDVNRWERLEVSGVAAAIDRQLAALRAEHGPAVDPAGATVTDIVLDLYSSPGRYEVAIDDLRVTGIVSPPSSPNSPGSPAAASVAVEQAHDVPAGLARGVIEVNGLPFFPRALEYNGEPMEAVAALGFNCVRLQEPAPSEVLAAARRCGLWVICPPPALPDVDIRDPESLPVFSSNWDRVLMWDLGSGLSERDLESLAERARRVRACDFRPGRPLVASADSGLRSLSRHIDMLVARRTVLGTSLELSSYIDWLRERPRLARPGTPYLASLSTELDPATARQASLLAGAGGRGLSVDPESLMLASTAAVAAGARGILFSSANRIDSTDGQAVLRAIASREMNLRLQLIEPWAASGRFASTATTSDPEVQAVVVEAARTRLVLLFRAVQGSQIVARRYHGDLPRDNTALSVLVPGVPEPHQAWLVTPTGLQSMKQKRVTGGMSLSLDTFYSSAVILLSGDPAITGDVQRRVRDMTPLAIESARAIAGRTVSDATALVSRLPPRATGVIPMGEMLAEAQTARAAGESAATTDPTAAAVKFARATAIGGQIERLVWERGVTATGSMVADALSTSDATLAEHWHFVEAIASAGPGPERLAGGGMDRIEDLSLNGWRHFAHEQEAIKSGVDMIRTAPAGGTGSLRMVAAPASKETPPTVVETPPVWITTPEVEVPAGKLVRIEADVQVPAAIRGSSDGLLVFDSLGGPALAERVHTTKSWRKLVLYRIAGSESPTTPMVVTFALTGLGEARLDNVSIRVMERGIPGTVAPLPVADPAVSNPATQAVTPPLPPFELPGTRSAVTPPQPPPVSRTPPETESSAWPGMNLEWPKILPFGTSPNTPPPGPGGGRIDPFKRAREQSSSGAGDG